MIGLDWVHIKHNEKDNLLEMRPSGQACPDEIHIRGCCTDTKRERSETSGRLSREIFKIKLKYYLEIDWFLL